MRTKALGVGKSYYWMKRAWRQAGRVRAEPSMHNTALAFAKKKSSVDKTGNRDQFSLSAY